FNLGADELAIAPGAFTIYIGTHGDRGAARADVVLPAACYTEKSGTYVNTEGRVQLADRANFPPGEAREDWAILRALSAVIGKPLPFDSLAALRAKLYAAHPHMARIDQIAEGPAFAAPAAGGSMSREPFVSPIADFYLTNPIARASKVMHEASALAQGVMRQAAE
ncbi:MAG: molybdopterin-dependent oxidoreductase, partial [Beijerinckiaceae bacterium]|nr:molybdopterin-dependent oxidoreductase [Beijerinckiaceae bacterium]